MELLKKSSLVTLISICLFLSVYRINNVIDKEISWDVLGYYLYLPATFIHDDPLFKDTTWLKKVNEERKLADTLYMVSSNNEGEPMYFFLMGTALVYLPFFFLGHFSAYIFGFPMDGFTMPYQYCMVIGGIIYTIIGLIFLRKILNYFFNEKLVSILLLIIVFGTNYIHHLTIKNLETVNILFMFSSIVIWFTIKWHQDQKLKYLIFIGSSITLMGLIKPSEIVILLFPILWNVTKLEDLKVKFNLLLFNKKALITTLIICFLIALPQLSYWYIRTGKIVYDSYKNPGVGLDFLSPHLIDALFSYRKGWLIYTPIMLFSLIGFYFIFKKNRKIFLVVIIYFSTSFFIVASWTEWWYGAAFSIRPLITLYPLLAISFGYFLLFLYEKSNSIQLIFIGIFLVLIFINQFQWWQLKNYILEPYRTTKAYYWSTFLQTTVTEKQKDLLLINRSFSGVNFFENKNKYRKIKSLNIPFKSDENLYKEDEELIYNLKNNQEFLPLFEKKYCELSQKDHVWIKFSVKVKSINQNEPLPCLVLTMERKEGAYGYSAPEIKGDITKNEWIDFQIEYLTPEIRNTHDLFKCYIWKRGKTEIDVKDVRIEIFEKNK